MPMTTTHALVPLAATLAFVDRPIPWRLVLVAAFAAAAPDLDGLFKHFLHLPVTSIYAHRGAAHALFTALAAGFLAAVFHRPLGVRRLTAGVVVAASMASHGFLDMMTNSGLPVAYLWPLSSMRFFADWRPIQSGPVRVAHLLPDTLIRLRLEMWQLIMPMFAIALTIRAFRILIGKRISDNRRPGLPSTPD
ncbi:MAG TPA: metal-dependent hydrolase [Sphingomicrobium sp.]|nr:metal-dependent hydrolase [Sphingomicrobium sp.]